MEQANGDMGIKKSTATPPNEELPTTAAKADAVGNAAQWRPRASRRLSPRPHSSPTSSPPAPSSPSRPSSPPSIAAVVSAPTTLMIAALLSLCALSCFFFHFTDSFRGPDGRVYYGFVTPNGLAVLKPGMEVQVPREERYRLGLSDFVHASMSALVFLAIAFSDSRVTGCLFPGHEKEMDEVMEGFPLMVGIVNLQWVVSCVS